MSFPCFDRPVPDHGYAWWYIDAVSDDGAHALTVIAFIGSVFSPYYRAARRRSTRAIAARHCALNIALYGRPRRWAMTERGQEALSVGPDRLCIGPSRLAWDGNTLVIDFNERSAPLARRVQGQVRVTPSALTSQGFSLDDAGHHLWHPAAPDCRVAVHLDHPERHWQGPGYLDHNRGDRSLETDFTCWDWSRLHSVTGSRISYEVERRNDTRLSLSLETGRDGKIHERPRIALQPLAPTSIWRMPRHLPCDAAERPGVRRTLEDTPFYARSEVATVLDGEPATGIHESLSLTRLTRPVVSAMLRCRMPRVARRPRGRRLS